MQYQQMLSWVRAHAASAGLAATLAFVLLYAVASLWLPFGWDHGMMAEVGDIMWRGGVIYRDAWDLKGPLAYVPFWLTTTLFGHTMWGIRLFEIILLAPCLYLLMRRVAAFTNFTTGAAAALALYLWIVSVGGFFFTAQPEIWTAAFAALAALVLMRRAGAPAPTLSVHAASGALIALCVLVKPHFIALAAAPMMAIASAQDVDFRRKSYQAIAFGGGLATPLLIAAIWLAGAGAWDAFIEAHITFNLTSYAGAPGGWFGVAFGVLEFLRQPALAVLGPLGLVGLWDRRREASVAGPLLALMLTALIVVILQGKLFVYHWFVIYPPIVIAAALGAHALWTQARAAPLIQALLTGAAIAFAAQVTLPPARVVVRWVRLQMGQFGDNYYDGYNLHAYVATDIVRAGRYLQEHTQPQDRVFVWGNDAAIEYIADRPSPYRYTHVLALHARGPLQTRYRTDLMRQLQAAPPAYIVVGSPWPPGDKHAAFTFFPEFSEYVRDNYALESTVGNVHIYHRVAPP